MAFEEENKIFDVFVHSKGLKQSSQRKDILRTFLKTEKHLTADELHRLVNKNNPAIGIATVYRTLKLIKESGLCCEFKLNDGTTTYEHLYNHDHHDHLICNSCGNLIEVLDPEIEKLQEKLARKHGFHISSHKLDIYGICKECGN
ncbi:MAG: transcriptional repressor [Nitrospiraceae bacterium]|nr:MAG: transcriptional repressor [Nitrospiraceae bacterium]